MYNTWSKTMTSNLYDIETLKQEVKDKRATIRERLRPYLGEEVETIPTEDTTLTPREEETHSELAQFFELDEAGWKQYINEVGVENAVPKMHEVIAVLHNKGKAAEAEKTAKTFSNAFKDLTEEAQAITQEHNTDESEDTDEPSTTNSGLILPTSTEADKFKKEDSKKVDIPSSVDEFAKEDMFISKEKEKFALDFADFESRTNKERNQLEENVEKQISLSEYQIKKLTESASSDEEKIKIKERLEHILQKRIDTLIADAQKEDSKEEKAKYQRLLMWINHLKTIVTKL